MSNYNLERLGWFNFEKLVSTLLRQVIGSGLSSFSGSTDQGRDATFSGEANFPSNDVSLEGEWIFQVKFRDYQGRDISQIRNELERTIEDELDKITNKYDHECDIYVFITNCPLTANNKETLQAVIESSVEISSGFVLGNQDIEELLDLHPRVVRAFPQLMGIKQLKELVNWGISQRSIEYLSQVQQELDTFVVTQPYVKALELLYKQHFCILTGAPKMGKTCNAEAIAAAFATDDFSVYDLRSQRDFYDIYDPDDKQLFICDDVFGDISLQADKKDEWTHSLKKLLRALDNNHKLIWTARSYILKEAIEHSKLTEDRPHLNHDTVVVNVENLVELEKAMILYNHAKKANLPEPVKDVIKKGCKEIVKNEYFAPESIRQLCTGEIVKFTEEAADKAEVIQKVLAFLKSPGVAWQKAFKNSPAAVQYICLQIMAEGGSIYYNVLSQKYESEVEEKGLKWISFSDALAWAEGTFLKRKQSGQNVNVQFYHPSMRDLLTELIQKDKVSRRIYIDKMSFREFANLITAIVNDGGEGSQEHKVLITDEDDIELLSIYIREKVIGELNYNKIITILSELLSFIEKHGYDKLSKIGKIALEEIARNICKKDFWESNYEKVFNNPLTFKRRSTLTYYEQQSITHSQPNRYETWTDILEKIKYIINHTSLNFIPEYIDDLLQHFIDYEKVIFWKMASLCKDFSEIITSKCIDFGQRLELKERLKKEVGDAIDNCSETFDSDHEDCDAWHDEYDNVLSKSDEYLEIFPDDEIDNIDELQNLMDEYPAYDPEPDYDRDDFGPYEADSFDISEIFKDL